MSDRWTSLNGLYASFDAIVKGNERGDRSALHAAILNRLVANRSTAVRRGWTSCALEGDGGGGRLRLFGLPPSESRRAAVPDWGSELGGIDRAALRDTTTATGLSFPSRATEYPTAPASIL